MTARLTAGLLALLLLLTGCTGSGGTSTSDQAVDVSDAGAEAGDAAGADDGSVDDVSVDDEAELGTAAELGTSAADAQAPLMVRSVELELVVDDVGAAVTRARATTTAASGYVSSEDVVPARESGDGYGSLVLRVPSADLDTVVTSLGELGEVRASRSNAEDVTTEYRDVEARIATMEAGAERLRELVAEASSLQDIADLESELTTREAELDALKARMQVLEDDVALSTITLHLAERTEDLEEVAPRTGFVGGLGQGWQAFTTSVTMVLTLVGALLPFALVASLVAVPALWWLRRRRTPAGPAGRGTLQG
ncbi:hypothetical protein AVL62_00140 [Serinicoccus chungangensis]|uniref:DUF4349 domain-containing protein n=1 Tax=Serinicoccus chungangensis TaxID=767452 RepID=A0A0W8I4W8_9MICO|nr:DUF4349 domain-containing protein [Serinicoccus chungangensis]KUG53266.1 hypothetical protein AVL62_00140 [Serinicoccus chungangensis]